jgi:hypothetical protein
LFKYTVLSLLSFLLGHLEITIQTGRFIHAGADTNILSSNVTNCLCIYQNISDVKLTNA